MIFDDLPVNDAITLYFEKHDALKRGDLAKLREMRSQHPELFLAKTENEIQALLQHIDILQRNPEFQRRYQAFCKEKAREKFTIIDNSNV